MDPAYAVPSRLKKKKKARIGLCKLGRAFLEYKYSAADVRIGYDILEGTLISIDPIYPLTCLQCCAICVFNVISFMLHHKGTFFILR